MAVDPDVDWRESVYALRWPLMVAAAVLLAAVLSVL
jgi:hypothetical protein